RRHAARGRLLHQQPHRQPAARIAVGDVVQHRPARGAEPRAAALRRRGRGEPHRARPARTGQRVRPPAELVHPRPHRHEPPRVLRQRRGVLPVPHGQVPGVAQMAVRLRRVAGWSGLLLAAALGAAIAVMAVVLATRPGLRKVIDLSPAKRFTITDDTIELLDELRKAGHTLELHTVYEPLGLPENATERDRYIYALRSSLQDLTTDLLRQYAAHGGEAVKVVHHDLRLHIDRVRELTRALDQRMANFVLLKVDQRNKVLSVDFDLAQIDFGQSQATRLPGQSREPKPILQDYKGEEAISSAIKSLRVEGRPKLYVLEGYREADISSSTSVSYSSLMHALEREGFQIARLNLTESRVVPDDAACVALFEPGSEM